MDRHTGGFADSHQARHDFIGIIAVQRHHFGFIVGRYAAHVVMHGGQNRYRFFGDIDTGKNFRGFGDAGQTLVNQRGIKMLYVQIQVIFKLSDTASFINFDGHGAADDVARGQILGGRRVAFHETLAFRIGQVTALASDAFGNQTACPVNAGRVKLDKFHILQRQTGAQHHGIAVAGYGMGGRARKIRAPVTTGGQNGHMRLEQVQRAVIQTPRQHAATFAVFHNQVEHDVFDKKFGILL